MNTVRLIVREFLGMFIDDGSLALFAMILIVAVAAAVKWLGLPPFPGGLMLLAGCLVILTESVHRAARRR